MNPFLVSFCNLPVPKSSGLARFDLESDTSEPVRGHSPEMITDCTGLARDEQTIYALVRSAGVNHIATYDAALQNISSQPLPEIVDGHSLLLRLPYLYIVSSGTDQVIRYTIDHGCLTQPTVVWEASRSGQDTHHVNSIAEWRGELLISAIGPKAGERWSTAAKGYIHNIIRDSRVKDDIIHPHSLSIHEDTVYYCESARKRFCSLDATLIDLDGYTRGVTWLSDKLVAIGTSVGRKRSKSTGLISNPGDLGDLAGECSVTIADIETREIVRRIPVGAWGPEIYDLLALDPAPSSPQAYTPLDAPLELNPLNHPILWQQPARLTLSRWQEHIPFAMLLVELAKPRLLVELGTFYGDSYCAFCQAVETLGLDTRCVAVDTWSGDPQTGQYGNQVLDDLQAHHNRRYGRFSRLLQTSFDEANAQFTDGSIDLLHIDGYHTYEAVRHDFETWRPKLSAGGVILFHDIAVRMEDYGVWRLWDELKSQYPSFEFHHGYGLGVLAVGTNQPPAVRALLEMPPDQADEVRSFFEFLGQNVSRQGRFSTWSMEHETQIADLQRVVTFRDRENAWLRQQLADTQSGTGYAVLKLLRELRGKLSPSRRALSQMQEPREPT